MTSGPSAPPLGPGTQQKIAALRDETIEKLGKLKKEVEDKAKSRLESAEKKAERTFKDLRWMIWFAFGLGFALLVISMGTYLFQKQTLEVLGIGALGSADLLALFLYKPMDRLQRASADLSQQLIILSAWAVAVNLHVLSVDPAQPDTARTAAKDIGTTAADLSRAIQEFVEK